MTLKELRAVVNDERLDAAAEWKVFSGRHLPLTVELAGVRGPARRVSFHVTVDPTSTPNGVQKSIEPATPLITDEDLEQLSLLEHQASKGPWDAVWGEDKNAHGTHCYEQAFRVETMNHLTEATGQVIAQLPVEKGSQDQAVAHADIAFICHARNVMPGLLACLTRYRDRLHEMERGR